MSKLVLTPNEFRILEGLRRLWECAGTTALFHRRSKPFVCACSVRSVALLFTGLACVLAGCTAGSFAREREVLLVLMGEVPQASVDIARQALSEKYNVALSVEQVGLPDSAYYKPRSRYRAEKLLDFLEQSYPGYDRVIGSEGGVAEEILGKALKDRRDHVVLATKVGSPLGAGPQDSGLSPSHILREVEASLKRLQTDYIDLYILHWPDDSTPAEETLRAIDTAVRQGKVRSFGVSNHWAWQIGEFSALAERYGLPRVVSSQIPLSLLRREYQHDLV
ncbi:MAG: aldo/keto reductase, partial [Armatimonadetes bacterium]|nr:aldo/keto reductase [Armatimonadota bacterium]